MKTNDLLSQKNNKFNFWKAVSRMFQKGGVYVSLVILLIVAAIISPKLLDPKHLLFILKIASILGIISIGQALLIITRGLDFSVGASATLVMVLICSITMGDSEYTFRAIIIALAAGFLVGVVNGLLVVKFHISPLVGSLGVMSLLTGITYLYTKGFARGSTPEFISYLGNGLLFGFLPVSLIIWLVIALVIIFILKRTAFGRYIFAVGANPQAAYMAGINPEKIVLYVYMISGLLTAVAAIIWAGYLRSPTLVGGSSYPLDSLTAVIIGGTPLAGGKGSILNTIIGTIIIVLLSSLLNMLGLGEGVKMLFQGVLILIMVFAYTGRKSIS